MPPLTGLVPRKIAKLDRRGPRDHRDGIAANPDLTLGLGDVDVSLPPEGRALAGAVRGLKCAVAQQPLRERGVEAACDRVFGGLTVCAKERSNFDRYITIAMGAYQTDGCSPDNAMTLAFGLAEIGFDREDCFGIFQHDRQPTGPVVSPLGADHLIAFDSENVEHGSEVRFIDGTVFDELWCSEREPILGST